MILNNFVKKKINVMNSLLHRVFFSNYFAFPVRYLMSKSKMDSLKSVRGCKPPKLSVAMYEAGKRPNFTVCVEGNIGCGKTTLLNYFSKYSNEVEGHQEPVDKWRNLRGINLLDLMYKDPCRWAHLFQTYVQLTMMELHLKPSSASIKLIERSIYSARYCFVENLYQSGKMSDAEYSVYCEWFKMITQNMDTKVDLIVYLKTNPVTVYERIKKRCRNEEQMIPMEYLQSLHELHEKWLTSDVAQLHAPVLVLDANEDIEAMYKKFDQCANDIMSHRNDVAAAVNLSPLKTQIASIKAAAVN